MFLLKQWSKLKKTTKIFFCQRNHAKGFEMFAHGTRISSVKNTHFFKHLILRRLLGSRYFISMFLFIRLDVLQYFIVNVNIFRNEKSHVFQICTKIVYISVITAVNLITFCTFPNRTTWISTKCWAFPDLPGFYCAQQLMPTQTNSFRAKVQNS